jgi:hypothetical protein
LSSSFSFYSRGYFWESVIENFIEIVLPEYVWVFINFRVNRPTPRVLSHTHYLYKDCVMCGEDFVADKN